MSGNLGERVESDKYSERFERYEWNLFESNGVNGGTRLLIKFNRGDSFGIYDRCRYKPALGYELKCVQIDRDESGVWSTD